MTTDLRLGRWSLIADRFWKRVLRGCVGECWPWLGAVGSGGYGNVRVGSAKDGTRATMSAHRVAYELAGGDASKKVVMHSCDVPKCCNPAHLVGGTHTDNMRDAAAKGRLPGGKAGRRSPPRFGRDNPAAKINEDVAERIRLMAASGMTARSIGRSVGISGTHVVRVVRGDVWPVSTERQPALFGRVDE